MLFGAMFCVPRVSLRSSLFTVSFRLSVFSLTFFMLALSTVRRGMLKLPAETVDLSVFPLNAIIVGFAYFEDVSLGTGNFRVAPHADPPDAG